MVLNVENEVMDQNNVFLLENLIISDRNVSNRLFQIDEVLVTLKL